MYDLLLAESNYTFEALGPYLSERGVECETRRIDLFPVWRGAWRRDLQWKPLGLVIQHRSTGAYAVVDDDDWESPEVGDMATVVRDRRCYLYLKAQYRQGEYDDARFGDKVRPWTYRERSPPHVQRLIERLRKVERVRPELFFRGNIEYANRSHVLEALKASNIMHPVHDPIGLGLYLRHLSKHRLALALPGHGNFCHREFEAFGIGTPVLMPYHKNITHDPLVSDHHYVGVDIDTSEAGPEIVAERIKSRYYDVINDRAFLQTVASNAMAWYDRNVRLPSTLALTARLLGLLPGVEDDSPFPGLAAGRLE